jgi:hypothetical protein
MIDQPGKLYLGNEYHPVSQQADAEPLLISARDLTTHAVCLGMTGTGKTGLGIGLLEEVLLQGIPVIAVDPKGDLANLALVFPSLEAADFKPWLTEDEAAQERTTLDDLAARAARKWRDGLAGAGIGPERLRRLRDRAVVRIFTPGSDAGIPVNVLQGLNPPAGADWSQQAEVLRERIAQVCSAILELAGIEADPMKSREHILLATIFEAAWRAGQPVDLALLIRMIQDPPITRVGVFDMDTFFPKGDRFQLAMALNTLAASPAFAAWQSGPPLDVPTLLQPVRDGVGTSPAGRAPASIFYVAHLSDPERQFFVTLLLSQIVMWMRAQTGTSVLRCLVYLDEAFGYLPPTRNPPTKMPLMTIVKQGRAAGVGLFMGTQNPADLDYKALGNIGTWFIGRLRTDRDRARALEGLESAGIGFDRSGVEEPLSTLPPRTFLIQTAAGAQRFLRARWAMSFLRGPLTRDEIRGLRRQADAGAPAAPAAIQPQAPGAWSDLPAADPAPQRPFYAEPPPSPPAAHAFGAAGVGGGGRPELAPDVRQVFLPLGGEAKAGGAAGRVYKPHLLASAHVRFADRASGAVSNQRYTYLLPLEGVLTMPDFGRAQTVSGFDVDALSPAPQPRLGFADPPAGLSARWLKQAERLLVEHVYRSAGASVWVNRALRVTGAPGEPEADFRARCQAAARGKRDTEAGRLHNQFERRIALLQDRLAREQRELTVDRAELDARKREETLTNIESVFNLVVGRGRGGARGLLSRGSTKRRLAEGAEQDVKESEQAIAEFNRQIEQAGEEYREALQQLDERWAAVAEDIELAALTPRKSDIFADVVALAWAPERG